MAKNGYWVVCYKSVSNQATVSEYAKLAATALEALGGRVIVGGKPAKTHEAGVDQSVVIVEFENLAKAIAAYGAQNCRPRELAASTGHKGVYRHESGHAFA